MCKEILSVEDCNHGEEQQIYLFHIPISGGPCIQIKQCLVCQRIYCDGASLSFMLQSLYSNREENIEIRDKHMELCLDYGILKHQDKNRKKEYITLMGRSLLQTLQILELQLENWRLKDILERETR